MDASAIGRKLLELLEFAFDSFPLGHELLHLRQQVVPLRLECPHLDRGRSVVESGIRERTVDRLDSGFGRLDPTRDLIPASGQRPGPVRFAR